MYFSAIRNHVSTKSCIWCHGKKGPQLAEHKNIFPQKVNLHHNLVVLLHCKDILTGSQHSRYKLAQQFNTCAIGNSGDTYVHTNFSSVLATISSPVFWVKMEWPIRNLTAFAEYIGLPNWKYAAQKYESLKKYS